MHKSLTLQVRHLLGEDPVISEQWQSLLDAVSVTYDDFDKDRALIERSLEISSTELKEFISLLQATINSTSEGILVVGIKGKITNHNKRVVEILQIQENLVVNSTLENVVTSLATTLIEPELFSRSIQETLDASDKGTNCMMRFKDGRTVEMNSKSQVLDGKSVGLVFSFRDITELIKAETELRKQVSTLERLNKIMIGRELKMIELKKKIKSLQEKNASLIPDIPESGEKKS